MSAYKDTILSVLDKPKSVKQVSEETGMTLLLARCYMVRMYEQGLLLISEPVKLVGKDGKKYPTILYVRRDCVNSSGYAEARVLVGDEEVEKPLRFYPKDSGRKPRARVVKRGSREAVYKELVGFVEEEGKGAIVSDIAQRLDTSTSVVSHAMNRLLKNGRIVKYGRTDYHGRYKYLTQIGFIYAPLTGSINTKTALELCEKRLKELVPQTMPLTIRIKQLIDHESKNYRWTPTVMFQSRTENPLGVEMTTQHIHHTIQRICREFRGYETVRIGKLVLVRNKTLFPDSLAEEALKRFERQESEYFKRKKYWGTLIEIIPKEVLTYAFKREHKKFAIKNYDVFTNVFIPNNPYMSEIDLVGFVEYLPELCQPRSWTSFFPISCKGYAATPEDAIQFYNALRYHTRENAIRLPNRILYWSGTVEELPEYMCPYCNNTEFRILPVRGKRTFICLKCQKQLFRDRVIERRVPVHIIRSNMRPILVATNFKGETKELCNRLGMDYMYVNVQFKQYTEWLTGKSMGIESLQRLFNQTPIKDFKIDSSKKAGKRRSRELLRKWFYNVLLKTTPT
jgi:predicted transcriptional regulator